ncbi:MAG: hypothetical protein K2J80_13680 [Oscillospiraceae bacterium]|nr:hypothetical protein [Oscillospiraceae bacterium]
MKKIMSVIVLLLVSTAAVLVATFTANADDTLIAVGTGGLQISDSAIVGDYTYTDNVLTIISSNQITISGTTTSDRIVVNSPNGANHV